MEQYYVYIMTCSFDSVFYIGMTNNLERRVFEHKTKKNERSFTARYKINKLLYYETFPDPNQALEREKKIKRWKRQWKYDLITEKNPQWEDLSDGWYE